MCVRVHRLLALEKEEIEVGAVTELHRSKGKGTSAINQAGQVRSDQHNCHKLWFLVAGP